PAKSLGRAIAQIVIADVSMSFDNVLAVAGAAGKEHRVVLVIGLTLSVALMGVAASLIATMFNRFYWISYVGLVVIVGGALAMLWKAADEIPPIPALVGV